MTYHLARNGQQIGTCSQEEANARYMRGEILPGDLVWCEGMGNWAPASQVFGGGTPPPPMPGTSSAASPAPGLISDAGKPSNNLIFAILVTLFCCVPTGIVSIVYASQVDTKWSRGDQAGALEAAGNAKTWCWVSLGIGLLGIVGYVAFMAFAAISSGGY